MHGPTFIGRGCTFWKLSLRHHQYNFQADDDDGGDVASMIALVVVWVNEGFKYIHQLNLLHAIYENTFKACTFLKPSLWHQQYNFQADDDGGGGGVADEK